MNGTHNEWEPGDTGRGFGGHGHHHGFGRGGFGGPGFGGPPFGPGFGFGGPPFGPGRGPRNRRGQVRASILALLVEEPRNGYQIMQALSERTQGLWRPSPGAVYPALNQLEDEGLIESFDNDGQRAFRLTEVGRQAAAQVDPPWEAVNARFGGRNPEAMHGLWQEFGGLAGATKELVRSGNPDHIEQATGIIAAARRQIYGLLAADPGAPNADDLR